MALSRKQVLADIRRLEETIQNQSDEMVRLQVERDLAVERAQEIAQGALDLRGDEVQERLDYKETNAQLIEFIKVVAASKSKFAKEAKNLLGM